MVNPRFYLGRSTAVLLLALTVLSGCGDELDLSYPRPSEPFEATLYDLVAGPIDRASAFDVVSGRGLGLPRTARVDQSDGWDVAFAVLDGDPVWLPRGFFESLEPSTGILALDLDFDAVRRLPSARESYEAEEPVPVTVGRVYGIRSRPDPALSLPCRIYAKLVVDSIGGDPRHVHFRYLWNPNCDDTNVTPEEEG
jgi:hypothetical protein